ncbi:Inhibin beta chain [Eumeta japonica]|uniref:Inhibin beta chain n=1 Tax=Eumeta variegata TaxID=151549 RepID=A0A4C1X2S1_EUMVA|nr:Inhibin beta chain [Eumeta japonica]
MLTSAVSVCTGPTLKGQRVLEFRLGREARGPGGVDGDMRVLSAELLVRAETAPASRGRGGAEARRLRYTLWAFTVAGNGSALTLGTLAGATQRDPSRAWQRLAVTEAARGWAARGWGGALRLVVDCSGCAGRVRLRLGGGEGARPLLRVRVASTGSRRRRRALECAAAPAGLCCRESYYVSFHTLGWDDWIVAPEGYHANYCRGACARTPDTFVYYHTQVVEAARMPVAACCAPLRFSPLSLIYFGDDSNIIKRDLPEMVVEECGCP